MPTLWRCARRENAACLRCRLPSRLIGSLRPGVEFSACISGETDRIADELQRFSVPSSTIMKRIDARLVRAHTERPKHEFVAVPFVFGPACCRHIRTSLVCHASCHKFTIDKKLDLDAFPGRGIVDHPS